MTTKLVSSMLAVVFVASAAAAQDNNIGPRWSAYAGCWAATAPEGQTVTTPAPEVCVVPSSSDAGADLLSLTDKKVTERTHVEADAVHHDISRQGCAGWESALWSPDGRRLYFNSEQRCEGGLLRKGSGIFAIGTDGAWTNVVNVSAGGGQGRRVLRYTPIKIDSTYPAEIVAAFGNREMSLGTARIAARTPVKIDDIIDANRVIDPAVVQAWVAASEQKFDIDVPTLLRLADAHVSPETIDIMIAVSNPKVFAVAPRTEMSSDARHDAARLANETCFARMMDPWGYYDYGFCDSYRRYGYYGSRLGYGYGLYGYDPYRGGYGYGYTYSNYPVVVVVRSDAIPHGKMTRNGYSNPGTSTTTAADRTPSRTAESGSSATSSGSGSASSGSSSSSGSSGDRTAHPKPPAR
jgi:hypothetical protein